MKGSTRKKGATWSFRIDLGKQDGKRKQIERSGFKTEKEAEAMMIQYISELNNNGSIIEDKKVTLDEIYNEFLEKEASITRKAATIVRYKSLYRNHLIDEFGCRYIGSISTDNIQNFLNKKRETHSDEYIRSIYNFLLVLFKYAIKHKYIRTNPMDNAHPPASYRAYGEIKCFTNDELNTLEKRLKSTNLITAYYLGINLGIREGECFALRFSDINWDKKTIRINKQLQFQNKQWSFIVPKTVSSVRTIKLGDKLTQYLLDLQKKYLQNKEEYGDGYAINFVTDCLGKQPKRIVVDDFINIKPNGEMLTTNSVKFISRIAKSELGIEFKYHKLRHTHTTMLAESGVNPKYVQKRLGHSKLNTTLNYYTHITDKMDEEVANIIDEFANNQME